ncbi:hypothetical protein QUB05_26915, partial [Microcoleus sp. F10-C6]|uniref:hypothetical protein n=1 Tax=unclassified Microcoleus TaxID=2642155 RepID=UPI002FD24DD0
RPIPQEKKLFVGRAGEPVPAIFARGLFFTVLDASGAVRNRFFYARVRSTTSLFVVKKPGFSTIVPKSYFSPNASISKSAFCLEKYNFTPGRTLPKKPGSIVVAIERIQPNYVHKPGFCVLD